MNNRKDILKHLLRKEKWNTSDKEWMMRYLDENDLSELEAVAKESYGDDLASAVQLVDRKMSERMLYNIHQYIQPVARVRTFQSLFRFFRLPAVAAAMIVVIAGTGFYFIWGRDMMARQQEIIETAVTENKSIELPDGSVVMLDPGSELQYPHGFTGKTREVNLIGAAYFNVKKNAAQPFIIHARSIDVTVVGTSFNVQAYPLSSPKVTVITGVVRVKAANATEVTLYPNQEVVFHESVLQMEVRDAHEEVAYFEQKQHSQFKYKGASVLRVVADLQKYYHTVIAVDDKIRGCSFYGEFNKEDDLNKALKLIAIALNAKVIKDKSGKGYLISGGGCQ